STGGLNDGSSSSQGASTAPSAGDATGDGSDGSSSGESDGDSSPTKGGTRDVALTAIDTAEADGGTVIELDHDDSGEWEVDVVEGDTVKEINISDDGTSIVGTDDTEA